MVSIKDDDMDSCEFDRILDRCETAPGAKAEHGVDRATRATHASMHLAKRDDGFILFNGRICAYSREIESSFVL